MTSPTPKDTSPDVAGLREKIVNLQTSNTLSINTDIDAIMTVFHQILEEQKRPFQLALLDARISILKRFSHTPAPTDSEWSDQFEAGVKHGIELSQQKLRFEINRLNKQLQAEKEKYEQK